MKVLRWVKSLFWNDTYGYWQDWCCFVGFAATVLGVIGALLLGICLALIALSRTSCNAVATESDLSTRYDAWAGCMVQIDDGRWVPEDLVKYEGGKVTAR